MVDKIEAVMTAIFNLNSSIGKMLSREYIHGLPATVEDKAADCLARGLSRLKDEFIMDLFPAPELPEGFELIRFVEADDHTITIDDTTSAEGYRRIWASLKYSQYSSGCKRKEFDVIVTGGATVISGTTGETIEPSEEPVTKTKVRITAVIDATITQADVGAQAMHFIEHLVGCAAIGYVDYSNVEDIKLIDKKYSKIIT